MGAETPQRPNVARSGAATNRARVVAPPKETRNAEVQAIAASHLGILSLTTGQIDDARNYLGAAKQIFGELGQKEELANCLSTLGLCEDHARNWTAAVMNFDEAIGYHEQLGDLSRLGITLTNRANTLSKLGRMEEAHQDIKRALELAEQADDNHLRGLCYAKLALLSWQTSGSSKYIIEQFETALKFFRCTGHRREEYQVLSSLEQLYRGTLDRHRGTLSDEQIRYATRKLAETIAQQQRWRDAIEPYEKHAH